MKSPAHKDGLLTAGRWALRLSAGFLYLAMALAIVGYGMVLFAPTETVLVEIYTTPFARAVVGVAVLILLGALYLCLRFVGEFRRILDTVTEGDPFQPANGDRLRRMAWLVLGANAAAMALAVPGFWLKQHISTFGMEMSLPLGGLALALTLFILARVFHLGAAMREDLEGTV